MSYYTDQLNNVIQHEKMELEHLPAIKVESRGNGSDTHWMSLNKESAEAIIEWLKINFIQKDRS